MFRSATFKLTLWYIALVMAISIIFSTILYQVGSSQIASSLHRQTARIYTKFPIFHNSPLLRPMADIRENEHYLLVHLILFNFLVLIAAGFGSYALARRTLAPIEEAHEQQKRFTADVSHELRTPLTALKMEAEVALLNPKSSVPELRGTLESVLEEATKLENLINSILNLTHLETDEIRQLFVPLAINDVINESVRAVQTIAADRHITLRASTLSATVRGDRTSLVQLFVILLDNAIKYSPKEAMIEVQLSKDNNYILIEVVDHGVGIEPQALDQIFNRFYRADNSRAKNEVAGFGLGLPIAKTIADVHEGLITISSQPGHGTKAIVRLPLIDS